VNGLPAIAEALEHLAWHGRDPRTYRWLGELFGLVEGRGACHFPDGATKFVASALRVFGADVREHLRRGPCERARRPGVIPVPDAGQPSGQGSAEPDRRARRAAKV
jgi:NADH-ubiquinone oxidoreductase subunit F-like iron-sulfur protein